MDDLLWLSDPWAFARNSDPDTSHDAAREVNVPDREAEVMEALKRLGGSGSSEDIADELNRMFPGRNEIPSNVSPRIKPLVLKNLVEFCGRKKQSRQGRTNRIWELRPEY